MLIGFGQVLKGNDHFHQVFGQLFIRNANMLVYSNNCVKYVLATMSSGLKLRIFLGDLNSPDPFDQSIVIVYNPCLVSE